MFVLYIKSKGVIIIDNWKSLTLENGGFIHVAFGAVLGIYAHGRTREKMNKSEEYLNANSGPKTKNNEEI